MRLMDQERAAKLVRIFAAGVRYFVEKRLDGKSGVRMADRAPPLHRDLVPGTVQINLHIGNVVDQVRRAFDRSGVNTILDSETLKHGAFEDGLTDDGVGPCNRISLGVDACGEMVV